MKFYILLLKSKNKQHTKKRRLNSTVLLINHTEVFEDWNIARTLFLATFRPLSKSESMKRQSQSVPNLNQEDESELVPKEEKDEDAETAAKHGKREKKKYKRLSKSFWNLFSPSSSSASKERRSESSVTAEKFVALTEEGEEEEKEEEKVDAALKDSLEDVKKVRHSISCVVGDYCQRQQPSFLFKLPRNLMCPKRRPRTSIRRSLWWRRGSGSGRC